MTNAPPTISLARELVESSPLADPSYRERIRALRLDLPEQFDLFDVRRPITTLSKQQLLNDALDYIEHVLAQLQVECRHSMSLGEAYGRSLEKVRALEAEIDSRTPDYIEEQWQSHFAHRERARDALLRAAHSAAKHDIASSNQMEIAIGHSGEWGCGIWIGRKTFVPRAGVLITLDSAGQQSLSVTCSSFGDEGAGCLHLGGELLRRIILSLDMTFILANGDV